MKVGHLENNRKIPGIPTNAAAMTCETSNPRTNFQGADTMNWKCTGILAGLAVIFGSIGESAEANGYCGGGCYSSCPTACQPCYTTCRVERRTCYRTVREIVYEQQQVQCQRTEYDTVYEDRPVTCYRNVTERKVRECQYQVSRPVWECAEREERYAVSRPVWETSYRDCSYGSQA